LTHNAAERAKNSIAKKPEQQISANENFQSSQRIAIGKKRELKLRILSDQTQVSRTTNTQDGRSNCCAPHRVFRKNEEFAPSGAG
jgi:hypothetical protein